MAAPAPQAPTAGSYTPVVTDFMRLVRVLYAPSAVFEEQKDKPTWFLPWLVIAVICIAIGFWGLPYSQRVMELAIQAIPNAPQISPEQLHTRALIGLFVTPIFFLIFAMIGAGIMYLTLAVTGSRARFRSMLTANVFAQVMLPITLILQSIILRMRGSPSEAITTITDAQPALGLNVLLSSDSHFMQAMYAGIGPLPIWALFITAVAIMRLDGVKKSSAWTAALASFVILLLVGGFLAGLQRG